MGLSAQGTLPQRCLFPALWLSFHEDERGWLAGVGVEGGQLCHMRSLGWGTSSSRRKLGKVEVGEQEGVTSVSLLKPGWIVEANIARGNKPGS